MPFPTMLPSASVMLNGAFGRALPVVLSVKLTFTVVFAKVLFSGVATIVISLVVTLTPFNAVLLVLSA